MNLEEEIRNGYTVPAKMKKVWSIQMDLLKKLLEVCEKNGLKIWADGGTLLGAIREHGYIPWDDDIDMAMLREDYDRLVSIANKEFESPYFFQCGYTEKMYSLGHAQLRMDGTTAILPNPFYQDVHQGVFIDIFPYDSIPNDLSDRDRLTQRRNQLFYRMQRIKTFDMLHPFRSIALLPYRFSFHKVFKKFEDLLRRNSFSICDNVCCISFTTDYNHFLRNKHWYDETILMPFEDIRIPVPSGYHQILQKQYGDYLVPRQSGSYHGSFWKLDPDKSYTEYLPEFRKYYSKQTRNRVTARIKTAFKRLIKK